MGGFNGASREGLEPGEILGSRGLEGRQGRRWDPGRRPPSGARDREIDPAQRLLAESTPKVVPITPSQLEAGAAARRRRNADRLLEKYGLKPRGWV